MAPSRKPAVRLQARYSRSGCGQRRETATTNPLPQPPRSLQTWPITLFPGASGLVAPPVAYCSVMKVILSGLVDLPVRATSAGGAQADRYSAPPATQRGEG